MGILTKPISGGHLKGTGFVGKIAKCCVKKGSYSPAVENKSASWLEKAKFCYRELPPASLSSKHTS
jgi:hypothetical protein